MNQVNIYLFRQVIGEIKDCFDRWDESVKNGLHPVPIQDLDYWHTQLLRIYKDEVSL